MKVKDLIKRLEEVDPELDCIIFAKGEIFHVLDTQVWVDDSEPVLEIGGGWVEIDDL